MRRFLLWVAVLLVLFAIVTAPEDSAASAGRIGDGLSSAADNVGTFAFTLFGGTPDNPAGTERTRAPATDAPTTYEDPGAVNDK